MGECMVLIDPVTMAMLDVPGVLLWGVDGGRWKRGSREEEGYLRPYGVRGDRGDPSGDWMTGHHGG